MESIVDITAKDTGDNPPPKKNAYCTDGYSYFSRKYKQRYRIKYEACNNDYYNKQYYQCVTSAKCTNNNASQVLKKMRQLIYCLHYLAQDDMSTITWCKTPPIQRAEDWASRMLAKNLSLQDLVIEKLREYEIKVQNNYPVFWSTVKTFQEKGLIELASNHYT